MKRLVCCLFLTLCSVLLISQELSTRSNRAARSFRSGIQEFGLLNYEDALKYFRQAISADRNFFEAHMLAGDVCFEMSRYDEAAGYYERAVEIDPDNFPMVYYNLGNSWMAIGRYEKAVQAFGELAVHPAVSQRYREIGRQMVKSCEFAINALENPVPFNPQCIGSGVNTSNDEYWPTLTADEQMLIFTRQLLLDPARGRQPGNLREDFYVSYFDENGWSEAVNIGPPLNSELNEGAPSLTADGRFIFFTACNRSEGLGSCDIYMAERRGNMWGEPANLGPPVNSAAWEAQPSISPDGKTLYFASNREGGHGKMDIWYSRLGDDGNWSEPKNLGSGINTTGNEMSPFIHLDNQTLYFSSDGHTGMGGYDLYVTRRDDKGNWGEPVNLGYPLNTHYDEIGLIVNARGDRGYFASDRMSGRVRDIYTFDLHSGVRPNEVSYMKGTVFDSYTRRRLHAGFELIDLATGEVVVRSFSDPGNGQFLVPLPSGRDYALNVSREGYLFFSGHFTLSGFSHQTDPWLKDIPLHPLRAGERTILRNIFFSFDSYELKDESVAELGKLIQFLVNNPDIRIRINGHTDNTGSSGYNMDLSEKRAGAVADYLIRSGIDNIRVEYAGFGETMPVTTNETPEGRAENRRTEFEILGGAR